MHQINAGSFAGALLGCAVGDAIGFALQFKYPTEKVSAESLDKFDYFPAYGYPPGQYTDDTQMTLAIVEAIIKDGEITGDGVAREFVRLWKNEDVVDRGISCDDAVKALMRGSDWLHSGTEAGRAGNGTAMRAAPVGLWNYDDIGKLVRDSETQSIITHKDKRCAVGSMLVAAAVADNIRRGSLNQSDFLGLLLPLCSREGGGDYARCLGEMEELLRMPERDALHIIARAGQEETFDRDEITPFVVPTVLVSLYAFLKQPHDFLGALAIVYRARGDIDTTGAITGAISGALLGTDGIPNRLSCGVMDNARITALGYKLHETKTAAPPGE